MKIFAVQFDIVWENPDENMDRLDSFIPVPEKGSLLLLPEMWSTGFTMNPARHAEKEQEGIAFQWMKNTAARRQCVVAGSLAVKTNENFFKNRFYAVFPDGSFCYYDKKHLFSLAGEHMVYTPGKKKITFNHNNITFCPVICYDIRFPAWCRNTLSPDKRTPCYDILLVVANWPESRIYSWRQLLIARAIENQCYVVAVNRIGKDGNGVPHSGHSMIIGPFGEILCQAREHEPDILSFTPDMNLLEKCRTSFPFWKDADEFLFL